MLKTAALPCSLREPNVAVMRSPASMLGTLARILGS
jgi:hypothetical protein